MTTEVEIFDGGNDKRKYYKWENAIKTNNQHCHHIFSSGQSRSLKPAHNATFRDASIIPFTHGLSKKHNPSRKLNRRFESGTVNVKSL